MASKFDIPSDRSRKGRDEDIDNEESGEHTTLACWTSFREARKLVKISPDFSLLQLPLQAQAQGPASAEAPSQPSLQTASHTRISDSIQPTCNPRKHLADSSPANTSEEDEITEVLNRAENCAEIARLKERPELAHHLQSDSSILALAVGERYIYAGTQDGEILVWSLASFELVLRIQAHTRAVLCLFLSADGQLLFSSAGDSIVNAWCPTNLKRLYHVFSTYDVGDVFSVVYSRQFETVYLGSQNTSIQWCSLKNSAEKARPNLNHHPDRRNHRFFDSVRHGGTSTPRPQPARTVDEGEILEIDKSHMIYYAHFGYVYCMLLVRDVTIIVDSDEEVLVSGGGDGSIKIWKLSHDNQGIKEVACLGEDDGESVLSMAVDGSFLYSSKLEGVIELWDLDTKQKLRVIKAHQGDVMTLQLGWGYLWSAGSTGYARKYDTVQYGEYQSSSSFSQKYHCVNRWKAHDGRILASAITTYNEQQLYITSANDNSLSIWNITGCSSESYNKPDVGENQLIKSLKELVSFKTISSRLEHAEDCRRGATFLRTLFKTHGAVTEMLSANNHQNPVVYAKFKGNSAMASKRKKILFYGHYDVVPADNKQDKWIFDPFQMTGVNGYLYGRGVSDNKGPIMAALYGVVDLVYEKELESDITFLIEGEAETGSRGFTDTIRRNKALIGDIDYIILANSCWLDDEVPCLTYGLRGILQVTVKINSNRPDAQSDVDGSFRIDEPLFDLTAILAKLRGPHNRIQIPGFYDNILPLTEVEEARYDEVTDVLIRRAPELGPSDTLKVFLMARWREPNLMIHQFKVSGPNGSLVSSHASAAISLRLVPNQEVEEVFKSLTKFLLDTFATLDTHNHLSISIDDQADAWLGDPEYEIFRTLEEAIIDVWGPIGETRRSSVPGPNPKPYLQQSPTPPLSPSLKPTPATSKTLTNGFDHTPPVAQPLSEAKLSDSTLGRSRSNPKRRGKKPLYIREGGGLPSIRFLEREFGAPAAHLPCGQASDSPHLDNERLKVTNLYKSREIFRKVFKELLRR